MNIVLFVNNDFEANLAYNCLKSTLSLHQVSIYFSEAVGKSSQKPDELQEIEYYERTFFFGDLQVTIKKQNLSTDFEFFGDELAGVSFSKCNNPNDPIFIEEVRSLNPDLFISIRFGKIFKKDIIKIPKKGIWNLHSAILPDYKGIMGTLHNLKDGRSAYGCTLHYIDDPGIDTGGVIEVATLPVNHHRSLLWHIIKLYPMGCDLITKHLGELEKTGSVRAHPQNQPKGLYHSVPTTLDFLQLQQAGFRSFDPEDFRELLREYVSSDLNRKLLPF
jgi:methionyl-tRNA formyltransferase